MQTSNSHLQEHLSSWHALLAPLPAPPPPHSVEAFVRGFVPLSDIEEEDILHFVSNLVNDAGKILLFFFFFFLSINI